MKLEYFDDACEGCGLLLLYGDNPRDARALRHAVRRLMVLGTTIELHELGFVESIGNCHLTAASVLKGKGVHSLSPLAFRWDLSPSEWEDVEGLLEPFSNSTTTDSGVRFQHLHQHAGPEVIYSTGREW